MTDTTKQEVDMGYIRNFVDSIAKALVDASELPKQIADIQAQMAQLSSDLEHTKQRNIELDTMLNDTRRQRDEAQAELRRVQSALSDSDNALHSAQRDAENATARATNLQNEMEQLRKDRDDASLAQMDAEDRAKVAEEKLKKMREALGVSEEPKPAPAPQPVAQTLSAPTTVTAPSQPEPVNEAPKTKRVYANETGFDWNKPYAWDSDYNYGRGEYFNEVAA